MKRAQLKLSTTAIAALVLLLGFNNCGKVAFQANQSDLDLKTDVVAMERDSSELAPPIETAMPVPKLPSPVREIPVATPAPRQPSNVGSGGICGFPEYPYTSSQRCTESAPTERKFSAVNGKTEVYSFSMYNTTNYSHAGFVLAPQGLSGDRYSTSMNVAVPPGSNKVILILSAYEPTHWNIIGSVERVQQVIVMGYHCASVSGVSQSHVADETGNYAGDLSAAVSKGLSVAAQNDAALVKAQYSYEGTCVDRTFVASP